MGGRAREGVGGGGRGMKDLMTSAEVRGKLGVSRSTMHRYVKERGFPRPLALSRRKLFWTRESVEKWLRARELDSLRPGDGAPGPRMRAFSTRRRPARPRKE